MTSPMRKNSQLPPISPAPGAAAMQKEGQKRDYSKPKSYKMMNQQNSIDPNASYSNDSGLMMQQRNNVPRGNTP